MCVCVFVCVCVVFPDEGSVTSSQPEIVTVQERIVNISSQVLVLSDYEETSSQDSAVEVISAANRPQSFPNPRPYKVRVKTKS